MDTKRRDKGFMSSVHFRARHIHYVSSPHKYLVVMDLDDGAHRASSSPFSMSTPTPIASPQSLELQDPQTYFQDSCTKFRLSLQESEIAFSSELNEFTAFHSGAHFHDMAMDESATSELTAYFSDDVFMDKIAVVPKFSPSEPTSGQLTQATNLRVNAGACIHEGLARNVKTQLRKTVSVVSPTMVDKKVLVTDNDLKLFSKGSMTTLSERKTAVRGSFQSEHYRKNVKQASSTMRVSLSTPRRQSSMETSIAARALECSRSLDESAQCTLALSPHWRADGFHSVESHFLSSITSSISLSLGEAHINCQIPHEVGVQQPQLCQPQHLASGRKIGIYMPLERRERLKRFHEKRKLRVYHKRIKYDCRKRLANSCPRVKGRFVKKTEVVQTKDATSSMKTKCM